MHEYFKTLDTVDPLFHAHVLTKLREIAQQEGMKNVSVDDLDEDDELEILRAYCVALYKEYKTLRTVFLENMVVTHRSVGMKHRSN